MDNKFTGGEWRVAGTDEPVEGVPAIQIESGEYGPEYKSICFVDSTLDDNDNFYLSETDYANAHLISASKDMYKALKELTGEAVNSVEYSDWPELQECIDKAEKALAKAEGKDNGCGDEYLEITLADVQKHYAEKDNG